MKKQSTLLILLLLCSHFINAQKLSLVKFSTGYSSLIGVENCGDSRLFIVEQEGKIFICDTNGVHSTKPYLDITNRVLFKGEQGLLGLAFDPKYATTGFFYVYYINKSGNTQVSRFKVNPDSPNVAIKGSEKFILSITQPFNNHKGGCIRFGPDGYLYIGTGDGGSAGDPNNNSQNTQSLLGKMLRIDVNHGNPYKVPANNPFVDSSNYKPEIWALGLRNPWRWSFDALNGQMFIGDVGQDAWEEVDVQLANVGGLNYGWRCYEGKHPYNTTGCKPQKDYYAPRYEYAHKDTIGGDCSITGGFVYRGTKYPDLYGKYIFTDYCSGLFRLLYRDGGKGVVKNVYDGDDNSYVSFGEDVNHELYVCNILNGTVYHIKYGTAQATGFSNVKDANGNRLSFSPNPSHGNININYTSAKAEQITIRVISTMGNVVYSSTKTVDAGANNWNMNLHLSTGNYYLNVVSNSGKTISQSLRIE